MSDLPELITNLKNSHQIIVLLVYFASFPKYALSLENYFY